MIKISYRVLPFSLLLFFLSVLSLPGKYGAQASFCYRLEEHLSDLEIVQHGTKDLSSPGSVTVWPDPEYQNYDLRRKSVTLYDDQLQWTAAGNKSLKIHDAMNIYAPDYDRMLLTLSVEMAEELIFSWRKTFMRWAEMKRNDYCFFKLSVNPDGQVHTYSVRLDNMKAWNRLAVIDGLQIETDKPAKVTIHKIELQKKATSFSDRPVGSKSHYTLGEYRQVLYAYTPVTLRYKMTLPEHPVFVTGLNLVDSQGEATFRVSLENKEGTTALLEESLTGNQQWLDKEVDLSSFAGEEVSIVLEATSDRLGQTVLWSSPSVYEASSKERPARQPNIVFYLVDALRADRLNAFGYERPVAPFVSRLAESGTRFQQCYSHESCTKASMMSLHSGMDSAAHGYTCTEGQSYKTEPIFFPALLRQAGYETCAVSQNNYTPPASSEQKLFSKQVHFNSLDEQTVCVDTEKYAFEFLEQNQNRSFYLYVHTMEVHDQMHPRPSACPLSDDEGYKELWETPRNAALSRQYDAAIAYADYNFRTLYHKLEELDLLENTIIVFASDHGEALGDHDLVNHGHSPFQHQIHIPFILSGPGIPSAATQKEVVAITDISATVLALAGIEKPPLYQGRNLLPLLAGEPMAPVPVFARQAWYGEHQCLIDGSWKLLQFGEHGEAFYDLSTDPGERRDATSSNPEKKEELRHLLNHHVEAQTKLKNSIIQEEEDSEIQVDPTELETLKALGYIN